MFGLTSIKKQKREMFKDKGKLNSSKFLSRLLTAIFGISLVITIIVSLLFFIALIVWPVIWIVLVLITLGAILATGLPQSPEIFLNFLTPIVLISVSVCVASFIARFIIEWIFVLTEIKSLKKDAEANAPYLNIAKVVKKVKIIDIVVFILMNLAVVGAILCNQIASLKTSAFGNILPGICFVVFILVPIAGKVISHILFSKVKADIAMVNADTPKN